MIEDELWLSFMKSGSVKDFLSYIEAKNGEVKSVENKDKGTGNKGEQYRG